MGSGVFRYSTYPVSDLVTAYKVTPSVPLPITSPGRSAGVGGERTGQKQSLLPPRHSSTTLPKLESVWARAPAGLRWDAVLVYPNLGLFTSSRILTWRPYCWTCATSGTTRWVEKPLLENFKDLQSL